MKPNKTTREKVKKAANKIQKDVNKRRRNTSKGIIRTESMG